MYNNMYLVLDIYCNIEREWIVYIYSTVDSRPGDY